MVSCDLRVASAKASPAGSASGVMRPQATASFDSFWPTPDTPGDPARPAAEVPLQLPAQKHMLHAVSADPTRAAAIEGQATPIADKAAEPSSREVKSVAMNGRKRPTLNIDKRHSAATATSPNPPSQSSAAQPDPAPLPLHASPTPASGQPAIDETSSRDLPVMARAEVSGHVPEVKPTIDTRAGENHFLRTTADAAAPSGQPTPDFDVHVPGPATTPSNVSPAIQPPDPAQATAAAHHPPSLSETPQSQAPAPSTPAPPAAGATPAPQLQQVLAVTVVAQSSGPQHLTIRLTPPELGSLQVRIDQSAGTPPRIEIKVEHAQTLDLLLHDQPRLHQALDQAGIPGDGRHITLSLDNSAPDSSGGGQRRASGSDWNNQNGSSDPGVEPGQSNGPIPAQTTWRPGGLDITA
jgi:flagellar hook-length control protein FliK